MNNQVINEALKWAVYIVQCADTSFYTGVSTDVQRRLSEHNTDNRKGARYTRARRPVALVYSEPCLDRSTACQREAQIKKLSRDQKIQLIKKEIVKE